MARTSANLVFQDKSLAVDHSQSYDATLLGVRSRTI